jgi:ribosome maturation factor RimP
MATNWQAAIERTVLGLGYELVDVERTAGGLLRVLIDRVPGKAYPGEASEFVTIDDCETVTRQLQYVLEVEGCDYARLEVSSPGLDRPLKRAADYERFAGSQVDVILKLPFQGRKKYRGLLCAHGAAWRLELEEGKAGTPAAELRALDFSLDEVREARLVPVVDFKGRRTRTAAPESAAAVPEVVDGGRKE